MFLCHNSSCELLLLYIFFNKNTRKLRSRLFSLYNVTSLNTKKEKNVKKQTRSLLEELNEITVKKDAETVIESRAVHVINSAINLIKLIKENFDPAMAYELERRLLNSIKGADPSKFTRGIRKLRDSKDVKNNLKIINGNAPKDDV